MEPFGDRVNGARDQLEEIREDQMKLVKEPDSLPPEERNSVGGPSQVLLDHPVIVGILNGLYSSQVTMS